MTAELVRYEPATLEIQRQAEMQDTAVARLEQWARSAHAAHEIAEVLVQTAFVPAQFRGEAGQATAAILAGTEVGLSPLASLKSFDIIDGTAAARAITLRAIVQSQGHEIVLEESTATRCKMKGRRRGSTEWQRVIWTIDRAKDLGLTTKGKNPDRNQWKRQPIAMLVARATSEICRLVAADAILGIGYTVEELSDGADPNISPGSEPADEAPKTRRMSRKSAGKSTESRSQEGQVTDSRPPSETETVQEATPPDLITEAQRKKLFATFNDLGITETDAQRAKINEILGREIESRAKITKDEASQVIDRLQRDLEQPFGDKASEGDRS